MSYRKTRVEPEPPAGTALACENCRCCVCDSYCPEPGCNYRCLGSHASSPDDHWCAEQHGWSTENGI